MHSVSRRHLGLAALLLIAVAVACLFVGFDLVKINLHEEEQQLAEEKQQPKHAKAKADSESQKGEEEKGSKENGEWKDLETEQAGEPFMGVQNDSLHIFSFATKDKLSSLCPMWLTALLHNVSLSIIVGEKSEEPWGNKASLVKTYLSALHSDTEVLFLDAFDTTVFCSAETLARRARETAGGKMVLFSGESNLFPREEIEGYCLSDYDGKPYPLAPTVYRFVNTGIIYASRVGVWLKLWYEADARLKAKGGDIRSDQLVGNCLFLHDQLAGNGNLTRIDYAARVAFSVYQHCEMKFPVGVRTGGFTIDELYNEPCIFHWNGPAKGCINTMLAKYFAKNLPRQLTVEMRQNTITKVQSVNGALIATKSHFDSLCASPTSWPSELQHLVSPLLNFTPQK